MQVEEDNQQYFEIDRNLNSVDIASLVEALNDLDEFLEQPKGRVFANTILLRIVGLMSSTNHFYVKNKIRLILSKHQPLFSSAAINRTQIINSLTFQLHASDLLTRLLYLHLINSLSSLFKYQISTYHVIMSKLSSEHKKQRKLAYNCLKSIFKQSKQLSKIFVDNLEHICNKKSIQIGYVVRLCYWVNVQPKCYTEIVRVLKGRVGFQRKDFRKLVEKALESNYQITEMLPEGYMDEYVITKYPFLADAAIIKQRIDQQKRQNLNKIQNQQKLSLEQLKFFCDCLYERKHHRNSLQINSVLFSNILNAQLLSSQSLTPAYLQTLLLCCFYYPINLDNEIQCRFAKCTQIRLLKILLTLKYQQSAKNIIEALLDTELEIGQQRRLMFYLAATDTFSNQCSRESLEILQEFVSFRSQKSMQYLLASYYLAYGNIVYQLVQQNQQANKHTGMIEDLLKLRTLEGQLTSKYPTLKPMLDCYISLIQQILMDQPLDVQEIKQKIRVYLPEHAADKIKNLKGALLSGIYFQKEVWLLPKINSN